MILKERDNTPALDIFNKAGAAAEEQMGFYLRRAFADKKTIFVINDLRIEYEGDAAQCDHAIVHPYGLIIIESKSVAGKVSINEHAEWTRWFAERPQGMPSPIHQARRQGEFLRAHLNRHCEQLRERIGPFGLFGQARFGSMPLDILVSISDQGIIERPKNTPLSEVHKADQICRAAVEIIDGYHQAQKLTSLDFERKGYVFSGDEAERIAKFLVTSHRPRRTSPAPSGAKPATQLTTKPPTKPSIQPAVSSGQTATQNLAEPKIQTAPKPIIQPTTKPGNKPATKPTAKPAAKQCCRSCQSPEMRIEYGKYGYYFKCLACDGNTPINATCPTCTIKRRIRKSGECFWAECEKCNNSELYWENLLPK
jgi:hypothetical protein